MDVKMFLNPDVVKIVNLNGQQYLGVPKIIENVLTSVDFALAFGGIASGAAGFREVKAYVKKANMNELTRVAVQGTNNAVTIQDLPKHLVRAAVQANMAMEQACEEAIGELQNQMFDRIMGKT